MRISPRIYPGSPRRAAANTGWRVLALRICLLAGPLSAMGPQSINGRTTTYPFTSTMWTASPSVEWAGRVPGVLKFARDESFPNGVLTLNEGLAIANSAWLASGIIDFDMQPLAYSDTGVIFRRAPDGDGEFLYLRANPECPAAGDCIQYAPVVHGHMQWDIYPDDQGPAPVAPSGWNHIRLLVSGGSLRAWINGRAEPSLEVPVLEGPTSAGGIALKGPARFANLTITTMAHSSEIHENQDSAQPPYGSAVVHWWTTALGRCGINDQIRFSDVPAAGWSPIGVEPSGLVDLGRAFRPFQGPALTVAWLKTTVTAPSPERRILRLGFARRATLFLNGSRLFSGDNLYYPEPQRRTPGGRLSWDDAEIPLALRAGRNDIVVAVGNLWNTSGGVAEPSPYGWGVEAAIGPALRTQTVPHLER